MQLKLRVGAEDAPLTINVEPTDTFQDLTDRLYSIGGVKVDLSQLKSNDKPFDMSTNVINYFLPKNEVETPEESVRPKRLCRLCSETINTSPVFLFEEEPDEESENVTLIERVNSTLPICVTKRDILPKQICEGCRNNVDNSFNFMKKVVSAQQTLEQLYHVKAAEKPLTNFKIEENCPLCTMGHFKQIDNNYRIINGPGSRIESQKKEVVISVSKNSASKTEGGNKPIIKEEVIEPDYLEQENIVTGFWDSSQDNNADGYVGIKKYRKRAKMDDDADWTIDEEYVPVSRRGRPRGTKNKPKIAVAVIEKNCTLCGWLGSENDMYAHAINQHCQPDMDYFPCPLCKTNQPNEMILETHIERHNSHK